MFMVHEEKTRAEAMTLAVGALAKWEYRPEGRLHSYPHELSGGQRQR